MAADGGSDNGCGYGRGTRRFGYVMVTILVTLLVGNLGMSWKALGSIEERKAEIRLEFTADIADAERRINAHEALLARIDERLKSIDTNLRRLLEDR